MPIQILPPATIYLTWNLGYESCSFNKLVTRLYFGVNNILDTEYSSYYRLNGFRGNYFNPSAGINYYGGVKLSLCLRSYPSQKAGSLTSGIQNSKSHPNTMKLRALLPLFAALTFGIACQAQPTITVGNTTLTENTVATGLVIPWEILWAPDDHIWITERRGKILRLNPSNGNYTTILDHQSSVSSGSERGMLGMTLHPDFENTPKVYVVYNYSSGGIKERLVSFDWNSVTEQLTNETTLINNIPGGNIHDGSRLLITSDNKILMTTGDVGSPSHSQKHEQHQW